MAERSSDSGLAQQRDDVTTTTDATHEATGAGPGPQACAQLVSSARLYFADTAESPLYAAGDEPMVGTVVWRQPHNHSEPDDDHDVAVTRSLIVLHRRSTLQQLSEEQHWEAVLQHRCQQHLACSSPRSQASSPCPWSCDKAAELTSSVHVPSPQSNDGNEHEKLTSALAGGAVLTQFRLVRRPMQAHAQVQAHQSSGSGSRSRSRALPQTRFAVEFAAATGGQLRVEAEQATRLGQQRVILISLCLYSIQHLCLQSHLFPAAHRSLLLQLLHGLWATLVDADVLPLNTKLSGTEAGLDPAAFRLLPPTNDSAETLRHITGYLQTLFHTLVACTMALQPEDGPLLSVLAVQMLDRVRIQGWHLNQQ